MSEPVVIETQQVLITEPENISVSVEREDVAVVSVGEQGPTGAQGQQGQQGVQGVQGVQGLPGQKGDPGPNEIGGYPIAVSAATPSDLVQFSVESKWINSSLLDGGNF